MAEFDIALHVLDHQLLDADGRRCGKVDDLALEGDEVVAVLAGPGVWPARAGRLGRLAARIGGHRRVRVPWSEVEDVTAHVVLRKPAREYGLGNGDDRLRPYIERIPGANR
jgi:sporulation protein YlmC with PRC-barrel domain